MQNSSQNRAAARSWTYHKRKVIMDEPYRRENQENAWFLSILPEKHLKNPANALNKLNFCKSTILPIPFEQFILIQLIFFIVRIDIRVNLIVDLFSCSINPFFVNQQATFVIADEKLSELFYR